MSEERLPLVVVSGYLGAGKTTLINRLLTEDHGLRLTVLVNDFGAINIDAAMISEAGGDTIALTNGCVCCTMGADLFMALGDALDRRPRPDGLVVEASGIADPARIAEAARAEPDLAYSGIITVVDLATFPALARDSLIGRQVCQQVETADLVMIRGSEARREEEDCIADLTSAPKVHLGDGIALAPMVFGVSPRSISVGSDNGHPDYVAWHASEGTVANRAVLDMALRNRPADLFRLKGVVQCRDGTCWEVQVVGQRTVLKKARRAGRSAIVGVGPVASLREEEIAKWWAETTERA